MDPTDSATAILPISLGTAAVFDQNIFPLAYYEEGGDNLAKGSFLVRATLEEMEKIKQLGIDLNQNEDFIFNTRLNVEVLKARKAKLQKNSKTLNPFKAFFNYRAARLFHAASRALYLETKRTSEKIHRVDELMRVVPTTQVQMLSDAVSPDAVISGISVDLPNGLDDDAKQTINDARRTITTTNPFQDNPLISQLRDDEQEITLADTASLLSQDADRIGQSNTTSVASTYPLHSRQKTPQTINVFNVIQNSIVTTNSSNLEGFTLNHEE